MKPNKAKICELGSTFSPVAASREIGTRTSFSTNEDLIIKAKRGTKWQ